jgi:hypothetical protein
MYSIEDSFWVWVPQWVPCWRQPIKPKLKQFDKVYLKQSLYVNYDRKQLGSPNLKTPASIQLNTCTKHLSSGIPSFTPGDIPLKMAYSD